MMRFRVAAALWAVVAVASLATNAYAQTPKPGGHLNIMLREDLSQGFAVHETSTISTSYPSLPCFNNLVFFDQLKRTESVETLVRSEEHTSELQSRRDLVCRLLL